MFRLFTKKPAMPPPVSKRDLGRDDMLTVRCDRALLAELRALSKKENVHLRALCEHFLGMGIAQAHGSQDPRERELVLSRLRNHLIEKHVKVDRLAHREDPTPAPTDPNPR